MVKLNDIHNVYLVGIKGVAMTALAIWAKEKGWQVNGVDVEEYFPTDATLQKNGIQWFNGFDSAHINGQIDLLIATGAHGGMTNTEVQQALARKIPVLMQGESLAKIAADKHTIAVAGTHGKTTTSAMIAHILSKNDQDPSYIIGCGGITSLGNPAHHGKGDYFVIEADEYVNCPATDRTPKLLFLNPAISVITNIEYDHPDIYPSIKEVLSTFLSFVQRTKSEGTVILCWDNENVRSILPNIHQKNLITYGTHAESMFLIQDIRHERGTSYFTIQDTKYQKKFTVRLSVPGDHNIRNATAALIAAVQAGVPMEKAIIALHSFAGTKRRFEKIAQWGNSFFFDDYAHHPTEIQATVQAARSSFPGQRLITIFQPHTFSRTKALLPEFVTAFTNTDIEIITDIYASAREAVDPQFSSKEIVERMKKRGFEAIYRPDKMSVLHYLDEVVRPGDIVLTVGAGDIFSWIPDIASTLEKKLRQYDS